MNSARKNYGRNGGSVPQQMRNVGNWSETPERALWERFSDWRDNGVWGVSIYGLRGMNLANLGHFFNLAVDLRPHQEH